MRSTAAISFALALAMPSSLQAQNTPAAPQQIIVDADSANEMDDFFAIAHMLVDPAVQVTALNSAHFNNVELYKRQRWHKYVMPIDPVTESQRENELILSVFRSKVPALLGADDILGFSWGYFPGAPIPSAPAIDHLITTARSLPAGQRLTVAVLGPLTNVAAAVARAPDIATRLSIFSLGTRYDVETGTWDKNDFNSRNDLNALDLLLNNADVEMTILPVTVAKALDFTRSETMTQLEKVRHPIGVMLRDRWEFVSAKDLWTMWDLALTLATAHPKLATFSNVPAPPENRRKQVRVITAIDATAMRTMFWRQLTALPAPSGNRP